MRKGFTLIELAIALMVIGLILAMAMKGRAVVDSAEIKSDMNRINKIQAALTAYVSKYNRLPGDNATDDSAVFTMADVYDDLVEEGLVSEADFAVGLEGSSKYFQIVGCENGAATAARTIAFNYDLNNVCLVVSDDQPDDEGVTAPSVVDISKFACYAETLIDDRHMGQGAGRSNASDSDDTYDYSNCEEAADVSNYSYIIF